MIKCYSFWINNVPEADPICSWIKSKCARESRRNTQEGKNYYNFRFSSSKKEWADAMHLFMTSRGCTVTSVLESEFEPKLKI